MADIFVSYTSNDREWAFWVGKELEALGDTPHIHEWEIAAGQNIYAWMEAQFETAHHVLCVISDAYLDRETASYSALERDAGLWQMAGRRPGFVLLIVVKPCKLPALSDHVRRCELYGVSEDVARQRFRDFMRKRSAPQTTLFPGRSFALTNIPIRVPEHFLGREDALDAIAKGLARYESRLAISALQGLRGVGKTTLAAAYAERHREDYRATWWIRAESPDSMRADLVGLGVRLSWVAPDEKEEPAFAKVMERLKHESDGILLIYDNAIDANSLKPFLPHGGNAKVLVTSNFHAWRGVAEPIEIRLWPKEIGADYLIARSGHPGARAAAEELSNLLSGLPLAHEQAAAYCERLEVSLADYIKRFAAAPARFLDDPRHAPSEYHDGLTVAKTFTLAIEEAAKLHPATEALIVSAAHLSADAIPLFLFSEGRDAFAEPLRTLDEDGLSEAIAALRAFALIDRENIVDERNPLIVTESIRLHRLVRMVAALRRSDDDAATINDALVKALASTFPRDAWENPSAWQRCRRLYAHAIAQSDSTAPGTAAADLDRADLFLMIAAYQRVALTDYEDARKLCERAVILREKSLGSHDPWVASALNETALLVQESGDLTTARPLYERALAIWEEACGPEHADTALGLHNLGNLFQAQGEPVEARPLLERALAIRERVLGADDRRTARTINVLGSVLRAQGDIAGAQALHERAVEICEKAVGPDHFRTAESLNELAMLHQSQGNDAEACALFARVLAIREKTLGPDHVQTAMSMNNLAAMLQEAGDLEAARPLCERALAIYEKTLGPDDSRTATAISNLARIHAKTGNLSEAEALFHKAIAIGEKAAGADHFLTRRYQSHYARLLLETGRLAEAHALAEVALAIHAARLGPGHPWTKDSARLNADTLEALARNEEAASLRECFGLKRDETTAT